MAVADNDTIMFTRVAILKVFLNHFSEEIFNKECKYNYIAEIKLKKVQVVYC